jgi:hypothetical protein
MNEIDIPRLTFLSLWKDTWPTAISPDFWIISYIRSRHLGGGGTSNWERGDDGTYFQVRKWCIDDLKSVLPHPHSIGDDDQVARDGTYSDIILLVTYNQHRPNFQTVEANEREKEKEKEDIPSILLALTN